MRQPKYRCWDGKKKKMLEGGVDFYTIPLGSQPLALLNGGMAVDPLFIQFTGLYDGKGTEVYEGDVIESDRNLFRGEGRLTRSVHFKDGKFMIGNVPLHIVTDSFNAMVVGNIYQNPELIEGEV